MDDEIKYRIEDLDRRIVTTDKRIDEQSKRFDDVKLFIGGTSTLFTAIFGVVVLVFGLNYANERQSLRDFQKKIEDQVTKGEDTKLEVLAIDGTSLSGYVIEAKIENYPLSAKPNAAPDPAGAPHMTFSFLLRNAGDSSSGPIYIKIYTGGGLKLSQKSSDESSYVYEDYLTPDYLDPNSIPGKMTITHNLRIFLPEGTETKAGRYPGSLKVYYGRGKVVSAQMFFNLAASR